MSDKINTVIKSYSSIIDLEESKEAMHLIADLNEVFEEGINNRIIKNKVITDIKIIQNLLSQVPKNKAPEDDIAINFYKAQDFVNKVLERYLEV